MTTQFHPFKTHGRPSFPSSAPLSSNRSFSRHISNRSMSSSAAPRASLTTIRPVTIPFSEIKDRNADLMTKIEEGFGPSGLGILSISEVTGYSALCKDLLRLAHKHNSWTYIRTFSVLGFQACDLFWVPGYSALRKDLLHLAPRLGCLPDDTKKELEDPSSRYNFGWSHGKEKLESGKPDMLKGSFYANPILDVPTTDVSLIERYPSYCGSNIWPDSALPELEHAFKALGKLIFDVGLMVAYHCDQYVKKGTKQEEDGLEQTLARSRCHKGRLLYYFPADSSKSTEDSDSMSSWCGWHTDHGSLTGLTCAMFTKDAAQIPCPDSTAGLYIRTRNQQIVKVVYGEDEIAYQIGETTEILSRGYLCATPHCVRAPQGEATRGVDRSTFALFMQPDWDEQLKFPDEVHIHKELILSKKRALTFGEYSELLLDKYYHTRT